MGMKAIDLIRAEQYRQQQEENTHDSTGAHEDFDGLEIIDDAMTEVGLFLDSIELLDKPERRHLIVAAARLATVIDGMKE